MTVLRVPGSAISTASDDPPSRLAPRPEDDFDSRAEMGDGTESPRPRRRRMPPPRTGRGPLFWIVMIFGVLVVGSCSCCLGVYALLPGERWRTHESVQGGYKVDLPAAPKKNMPIPGLK